MSYTIEFYNVKTRVKEKIVFSNLIDFHLAVHQPKTYLNARATMEDWDDWEEVVMTRMNYMKKEEHKKMLTKFNQIQKGDVPRKGYVLCPRCCVNDFIKGDGYSSVTLGEDDDAKKIEICEECSYEEVRVITMNDPFRYAED